MISLNQGMGWMRAWRMSKENGWRLLIGFGTAIRVVFVPDACFIRLLVVTFLRCGVALSGLVGSFFVAIEVGMSVDIFAGLLAFVLVLVFAVALMMDIALVLPMIIVTRTMGWTTLRGRAQGRTGKLALALTLAFVFAVIPVVFAGLPASLVGHALSAVNGIAGAIGFMMLMGSFAEAYRQLGGPELTVPESVLAVFDDDEVAAT